MAELERQAPDDDHPGTPAGLGCPACGGALWEIKEGDLLRFRCRIGHAWSAEGLVAEQADALEAALWTAIRALEEKAALARRLVDRSTNKQHTRGVERFLRQEREAIAQAGLIRQVLLSRRSDDPDETVEVS